MWLPELSYDDFANFETPAPIENHNFEKEAVSGLLTMWDRSGVNFAA